MKLKISINKDYEKELLKVIIPEEYYNTMVSLLVNSNIATGNWEDIIIPVNGEADLELFLTDKQKVLQDRVEVESLIVSVEDLGDRWDIEDVKVKFTYDPINDIKNRKRDWYCLRGVTVEGCNMIYTE